MAVERKQLLALAEAVADGRDLNWETAEAETAGSDRELVRQLQLIAGIAEAHRSVVGTDAADEASGPEEYQAWGALEIRETIGAGTFGTVFRAWDPKLEREVALKLMRPGLAGHRCSTGVVEEGRLLARVRHPHVITVFGADAINGRVGVWMELIKGRTLEQILNAHGPLSVSEAAAIGTDLAAALAAVHRSGLVHRDVKTQNVMREEGGRIVLMDFGAGGELTSGAATHRLVGTPAYMAPEIFTGSAATPQSDIFSLGVLLFRALTGTFPLEGRTASDMRRGHEQGAYRRLVDLRPELPPAFVAVVERAIAVDPNARFQSAGDMAAALSRALHHDRRELRHRVSRRTKAILLAIALAGAAAGGWTALRPSAPPVATTAPRIYTVAVLPLVKITPDAATDYLATGVSEILSSRLSSVSAFRVLARSSIAALASDERSPAALHRSLGVDFTVEGSVEHRGDRLRVTARLVQASSGTILWGDTFDRPLEDLFSLQGEVATAIAAASGTQLSADTTRRLLARHTTSVEAQEAYLQSRHLLYTFSRARLPEAIALLERAVQIDPGYALAHASLARTYALMVDMDLLAVGQVRPQAVAHARRAYELDPDLAEANVALADVLFRFELDWTGAEAAYRRALSITPHSSLVLTPFSRFLCAAGRLDEALVYALAGEQADPLSAEMVATVGIVHYYRRDHEQTLRYYQRVAERNPDFGPVYFGMARAYAEKAEYARAVELIKKAMQIVGPTASYRAELARTYALGGWRDAAEQVLGGLLIDARNQNAGVSHEGIGYAYAALGDTERAFEWLNRAVDQYAVRLSFIKVDPRSDPLRADPRFAGLVRRLGLEP